jgi:hypothetical protein
MGDEEALEFGKTQKVLSLLDGELVFERHQLEDALVLGLDVQL